MSNIVCRSRRRLLQIDCTLTENGTAFVKRAVFLFSTASSSSSKVANKE